MRYESLDIFLKDGKDSLAKGPVALIFAEDDVEVASTLRHHLAQGFKTVILFAPDEIDVPKGIVTKIVRIRYNTRAPNMLTHAVNALIAAAPGIWFYYCYNAEYLFFPFCETRTINDLLTFHTEERRDSMLTYVIDLYAGNLWECPSAVSLEDAHLDRSGYYALGRSGNAGPKERQLDFFGGLRWRFEEHVEPSRRRIDRISIFKAKKGLKLSEAHLFNDEEYNTYACPWHNNITAAVGSFRTAKALKANAGSTFDIDTFMWHNSTEFKWNSQQLLSLGLIEPGQWF
ncbi:glycosyltransferase family 2 protein [Celeribacter sp.]|uniref:glycosyltransferase family 2 protein n=1 Tax=Celeribacter sp. TaxID=1890673 RepID=UPI003A8F3410